MDTLHAQVDRIERLEEFQVTRRVLKWHSSARLLKAYDMESLGLSSYGNIYDFATSSSEGEIIEASVGTMLRFETGHFAVQLRHGWTFW
jgi:hypothetical protein